MGDTSALSLFTPVSVDRTGTQHLTCTEIPSPSLQVQVQCKCSASASEANKSNYIIPISTHFHPAQSSCHFAIAASQQPVQVCAICDDTVAIASTRLQKSMFHYHYHSIPLPLPLPLPPPVFHLNRLSIVNQAIFFPWCFAFLPPLSPLFLRLLPLSCAFLTFQSNLFPP